MRVRKYAFLIIFVLAVLLSAQQGAQTVAKVDEQEITTADLAIEFNFMDTQRANQLLQTAEGKSQVLETLIRRQLLLKEAREEKLDTLPQTRLLVQRNIEDVLIQTKLEQIAATVRQPTEEEIQQVYDNNDSLFYSPKSIHLIRIVGPDKESAEIAHASLKGGIDFQKLMQRTPGTQQLPSGDIGWVAEDNLSEDIKTVLTKLKVGEFSEPIQIGDSWQIFYVEAKRDAGKLPIEDVKPQIVQALRQELADQAINQYQEEIMQEANIQIDENTLKSFGQGQPQQPVGN